MSPASCFQHFLGFTPFAKYASCRSQIPAYDLSSDPSGLRFSVSNPQQLFPLPQLPFEARALRNPETLDIAPLDLITGLLVSLLRFGPVTPRFRKTKTGCRIIAESPAKDPPCARLPFLIGRPQPPKSRGAKSYTDRTLRQPVCKNATLSLAIPRNESSLECRSPRTAHRLRPTRRALVGAAKRRQAQSPFRFRHP